ncbi:YqiA/YcfP family alpha/beta fold hydrolase [Flocculibacter collagenilyticus]|uniref:YqiA/YcfP family alpha/beta fold hydrolase n=1 Tax=Flocculibacter collagenilyticus TaxID=2744479 RepID=UPI0018F391FE|nr:YqiA/YcfP family alpha/beta fold hydrolase [Flocculibacter collagenilyticus]
MINTKCDNLHTFNLKQDIAHSTLPVIIYLHGFNSSRYSEKATLTQGYFKDNNIQVHCVIPQLCNTPKAALEQITELINRHQDNLIGFIGSSLGGYLATYFVEKIKKPLKAVLINPAVDPYNLFPQFLGEQVNLYTEERYVLAPHHVNELHEMNTPTINFPKQYWLLQQTEDEVLNYQLAVEKYKYARQTVEVGGNHAFIGYERFLPDIVKFFELA